MASTLHTLTAIQVLELFKTDTVTVEAYARSLLNRIRDRDSIVKAWVYLDAASVISQAQALDKIPRSKRGMLHGLAIGVKDVMNTKGKTTTTEFTITNSGPETTNPHDPTRTPGGSSCGSAAAVADFQVPVSLGSQTGGSVIRPASFTGVFAYKPTHNAISLEGQKPVAPTFDTIGFFTRSIDDINLLAELFAIQDDEPPRDVPLAEMTIALMKTPMWSTVGPGTVSTMKEVVTSLTNAGVKVEDVCFPTQIDDAKILKRIQEVIMSAETRTALLKEHRLDKTQLATEICKIVENATGTTNSELVQAIGTYNAVRSAMNDLAAKYTVILAPSATDEAPLGLHDMGSGVLNTTWTGLHMPVINIPARIGAHGMPIGVSLVAPCYRDQHLIKIGKVLGGIFMA